MKPSKLLMQPLVVNSHMKEISDYFGGINFEPADIPGDIRFVFVCFTNRSGSNFLAELLSSSGYLNTAEENFNAFHVVRISKQYGLKSFQEYFSFLVNKFQKNNVFCVKTAIPHLELLRVAGILDQIAGQTSFVEIERSDKLAQAISHVIAFETEKYTSKDEGKKSEHEVAFSESKITEVIKAVLRANFQMDTFLSMNCLPSIKITYEMLMKDPAYSMSFVSDFIGYPKLDILVPNVRIKKQASRLNDDWRNQYMSERFEVHDGY